jgi:hypothetical protein
MAEVGLPIGVGARPRNAEDVLEDDARRSNRDEGFDSLETGPSRPRIAEREGADDRQVEQPVAQVPGDDRGRIEQARLERRRRNECGLRRGCGEQTGDRDHHGPTPRKTDL